MLLKTSPVTQGYLFKRAKRLHTGWNQVGGRNVSGRITSFKKGAFAVKRVYRFIDFWRRLSGDAFIVNFEFDGFRSSTLALIFYQTGFLSYVLLPEGFSVGDKLKFDFVSLLPNLAGNLQGGVAAPLKYISDGSFVFNVELWPLKGAQICRAAGTYAIIVSRWSNFVTLKLRSGWKIVVSEDCFATSGIAPNYKHIYRVLRKAGVRVNCGRRPTVRGVAMNAIDHPHGGGRGKTSGGPRSRTPWGALTKQRKTVSKKFRVARQLFRFR